MRVLVTNTVVLNGGDAAILLAIERHVRHVFGHDTEFVVADTQPDLAARYYPSLRIIPPLYHHAFPPRRHGRFAKIRGALRFVRWYTSLPRLYLSAFLLGYGLRFAARLLATPAEWRSLREYADANVIISTGGTYLVENYWLAPRIFDFRIALLLDKPLVLYTQSMGPFEHHRVRGKLKDIFRNSALILLRDQDSLDHVHDLCEPNEVNVCLAADAVFSLADPNVLARAEQAPTKAHDRLRVAISVRRWPFFRSVSPEEGMQAYREAIAHLVRHLVDRYDADVVFLSTCQGVDGYAYDDSAVGAEIRATLPGAVRERVSVDFAFHRPEELLHLLGDVDLVVATRMHAAILGLAAGTPVLPISYEFKTQALFEGLGMARFVHDIEDVTGRGLAESVDALLADMPSIRKRLFQRVESERRRASAAEDGLAIVQKTRLSDSKEST